MSQCLSNGASRDIGSYMKKGAVPGVNERIAMFQKLL